MTTTISASPQTMVDSATQLTKHDPMYSQHSLFNPVGLPDPAHLQPSLAKRRTKADRRLLFELGRTKKTSTRRSSHKAMGKRMFFRLSGRHHMQTSVPPSHEEGFACVTVPLALVPRWLFSLDPGHPSLEPN